MGNQYGFSERLPLTGVHYALFYMKECMVELWIQSSDIYEYIDVFYHSSRLNYHSRRMY